MTPALEARSLSLVREGAVVLNEVSFTVAPGEVYALLGGNGAGKSTILKVLNGVHRPDAGTIAVGGVALTTHTPEASRAAGIAMNFQEMSLIPTLSVAQNIFLTREARTARGFLDDAACERKAAPASIKGAGMLSKLKKGAMSTISFTPSRCCAVHTAAIALPDKPTTLTRSPRPSAMSNPTAAWSRRSCPL